MDGRGEAGGDTAGMTNTGAVTLNVLSAGAIRRSVSNVAQLFMRATGTAVATEFAPAPELRRRVMAGDAADVIITSAGGLDALTNDAKVLASTRSRLGRTR